MKMSNFYDFLVDFLTSMAYNRVAIGKGGFPMLNIVLVEPEIPQNCGNIARTCAATGCRLHLIRPLGFDISEKAVKRAGLDYWNLVEVLDYENLDDFFSKNEVKQMWCLSTKAPRCYTEATFEEGLKYAALGSSSISTDISLTRGNGCSTSMFLPALSILSFVSM